MNRRLIFALMFLFALPLHAYCDDGFTISSGSEITLAQITPASPPTGTVRTPAPPRAPTVNTPPAGTAIQVNPSLAAATQMVNIAAQMDYQCKLHERELYKIISDPSMVKNPMVKSAVQTLQVNSGCSGVRRLREDTEKLYKTIKNALSQQGSQK